MCVTAGGIARCGGVADGAGACLVRLRGAGSP